MALEIDEAEELLYATNDGDNGSTEAIVVVRNPKTQETAPIVVQQCINTEGQLTLALNVPFQNLPQEAYDWVQQVVQDAYQSLDPRFERPIKVERRMLRVFVEFVSHTADGQPSLKMNEPFRIQIVVPRNDKQVVVYKTFCKQLGTIAGFHSQLQPSLS